MKYLYLLISAGAGFAYAAHTHNSTLSLLVWVGVFAVNGWWHYDHSRNQ